MLDETGVDGVMIGRAALGNPWMIYRTVQYLETGKLMGEPSDREMRKHAAWYLKGIRGNAKARNAINECNTRDQLVNLLNDLVIEVEQREQNEVNVG